jgi:hypothetical protein
MKLKIVSVILAITAMMSFTAKAQLGGLGGLIGGKATPESLMGDLTSGQQSLVKAIEYFNQAFSTKTNLAERMAIIKEAKGPQQSEAVAAATDETLKAADEFIASGKQLTKEQKELTEKAKKEIGAAVLKYTLLGVAVSQAGNLEAQVAVAINEGIKFIPTVTKLSGVIAKINKIKVAK